MKQWIVTGKDKGFDGMSFGEAPMPKVGENEVLVKFEAASLNYRDLIIPKVRYYRTVRDTLAHELMSARESTRSRFASLLSLAPTVPAR